jgi:hypothetical protein
MDDTSDTGGGFDVSQATDSIAGGFGEIGQGIADVATSTASAGWDVLQGVGDVAATVGHQFAAAGDALLSDIPGATAQNAAGDEAYRESVEHFDDAAKEIGF